MKKLLFIFLLFTLKATAQTLRVESLDTALKDLSASVYSRMDSRNKPCALLKVQFASDGASFEGDIIGEVKYRKNEYWVYLQHGATSLKISHPLYGKLNVMFSDYNINQIEGKTVYVLTLLLPEYIRPIIDEECAYFSSSINLRKAHVEIDGNRINIDKNGSFITKLIIGEHNYRVRAIGYDTYETNFILDKNGKNIIVTMKKKNTDSAFNSTPKVINVKGVKFNMIPIEGGSFIMGATYEQEEFANKNAYPIHEVRLKNYMIGETEVTQKLWKAVMNTTCYYEDDNIPIQYITWYECKKFISKLNTITGLHFRLPTEAEWEYAARGGQKSAGYRYSGGDVCDEVCWYTQNYNHLDCHPVKKKKANELKLYDMSGNVMEWCEDWYGNYSSSLQDNPQGPITGTKKVARGGFFGSYSKGCIISNRVGFKPDEERNVGLRLVLDFTNNSN